MISPHGHALNPHHDHLHSPSEPHYLYGRNADGVLGAGGEGLPPEEIVESEDYSIDHLEVWKAAMQSLARKE